MSTVTKPPSPAHIHAVHRSGDERWAELLRRFQQESEALAADTATPGGPVQLALAVVAEALDIGATIAGSIDTDADTGAGADTDADAGSGARAGTAARRLPDDGSGCRHERCRHEKVTTAPAGVDYRHLERRTRALRSALDGIDDYVWWGGLAAAG